MKAVNSQVSAWNSNKTDMSIQMYKHNLFTGHKFVILRGEAAV